MTKVLSIDWDYFVEEDPHLDFGHREIGLFLSPKRGYGLYSAESHQMIVEALEGKNDLEIVNIDAHHDIWYKRESTKKSAAYDCGSWGAHLINQGRVKSFTQIYPEWRKKFPECGDKKDPALAWARKKLGENFQVFTGDLPRKCIPWKNCDVVFMCRSGCWTPPEYDARFNKVLKMLGGTPIPERKYDEEKAA